MPVYIEMPKLSDTMTEGTLLKWRKNKGDTVTSGDILAEIETDKATMEMEAFDDGILAEVYVQDGGKATVGQKIALLLAPGEKPPAGAPPAAPAPAPAAAKPAEGKAPAPSSSPAPAAAPAKGPAPASPVAPAAPAPSGARVKASPLAKKIAASKGIDLSRVTGTGPGARIVSRDLDSVSAAAPKTASSAPAPVPAMPAGPDDKRIPLSGMRKVIAERLVISKSTIPHFYLNIEVNAGELMQLRAEVNANAEKSGQPKLTVNDFILKAAVVAASRVPKVNAAFDGDAVIEYASINLAVAVAIDDGLVTPVIRNAQNKSLLEINAAVKDLATRARGKKLKPDEYQGGTITVSNLGAYGIDSFSAIINPPQSIILSVGAVVKKPVVNAKNEIVVGQRLNIGLSCDHRVVDGAIGAEYLAELRKLIENPALMLI